MAVATDELAEKLLSCLGNASVCDAVQNLLAPVIAKAVEEAIVSIRAERNAEIVELKQELKDTKRQLNEIEQYSRRNCINISGIPEKKGEDTDKMVLEVCRIAGAKVEECDIDLSHRIGKPTEGKTRRIIVRFAKVSKRNDMYAARRKLREARATPGGVITEPALKNIFISENLTRENEYLMFKARRLREKGKLYAVWSDQGRLKTRVSDGAPTRIFGSVDDLVELVGEDPDLLSQGTSPSGAPGAATGSTRQDEFRTVTTRSARRAGKR